MPDLTSPEQRSPANAIITLMYKVGGVLAFMVGGALFRVSPNAPFVFGAVGLLVAVFLVVALIREPEQSEAASAPPGVRESLRTVLADEDRSVIRLLVAIFAWTLGVSALEVFFTSYAVNQFNQDSGQATMLLACFALAGVLGSLPAGYLGLRLGRRTCLMAGLLLLIGLLTTVYTLNSVAILRLMLILMGLSWSLVMVNALPLVLDFAPSDRSGAYTGLFFLATQLASVFGPVMAGRVLDLGGAEYRLLFLWVPFTMAVACGFMAGVRRTEQPAVPVAVA